MKKLLIVAVAVLLAGVSEAAMITWNNAAASKLVGLDGATAITAANASSWNLTLTLMYADGTSTGSTQSSINGMTAGVMSNSTWTYTYGTDAQSGDAFYIKALMTVDGTAYEMNIYADGSTTSGTMFTLGSDLDNTSRSTFTWASGTYGGSSWTAQSVPEPTSGLLLLLGVVGLALRRKRA